MQSWRRTEWPALRILGAGWAVSSLAPAARAVSPSGDAMVDSRCWVAAAFEGTVAPAPTPGMEVLANYDLLRRLVAEWRRVAACYLGDFYPLSTTREISVR